MVDEQLGLVPPQRGPKLEPLMVTTPPVGGTVAPTVLVETGSVHETVVCVTVTLVHVLVGLVLQLDGVMGLPGTRLVLPEEVTALVTVGAAYEKPWKDAS